MKFSLKPSPLLLVISIFLYIFASGVIFNFFHDYLGISSRVFPFLFFIIWAIGWITLIFSFISGSTKDGFQIARYWIGGIVALSISIAPFAFLPHPIIIMLGVFIGVLIGSIIAIGKPFFVNFFDMF